MKKFITITFLVALAGVISSFKVIPASVTATKPTDNTITLSGLYTRFFIPRKTTGSGGDNDFFGHGPVVRVRVEIFLSSKATLTARVNINAYEEGGDGTSASGTREELLYFAGFTNEILSISSPASSRLSYKDGDHNDDYVTSTGEVQPAGSSNSWYLDLPTTDLVRFAVVVGDTEGQEVGTRTAIKVYFNPITIKLKNPAAAPMNDFKLNVAGVGSCGESTCSASAGAGLLQFYGFKGATCEEFWRRENSVGHFVNWARQNNIANMGMPPSIVRDKLKEFKPEVQLRMLTTANYFSELRRIIKVQRRPVIALVGWGSRIVRDYYAPLGDSYGFGNAGLHYVIIDGFNDGSSNQPQQRVWHVIDNGVRITWSDEYLRGVLFWKPENFVVEGVLYPQDVHPGNVVY